MNEAIAANIKQLRHAQKHCLMEYSTMARDAADSLERLLAENERFAEINEAQADGRLIELPCKVGDTVYTINMVDEEPDGDIEEQTIYSFVVRKDGRAFLRSGPWDGGICYADELGKIVGSPFGQGCYLTRKEAVKASEGDQK